MCFMNIFKKLLLISSLKKTILFLSLLSSIFVAAQLAHSNETYTSSEYSNEINFNTQLSEAEFNDLFLASLQNDKNGQLLLSVSDSLSAQLHPTHVEFSAVINLDKVEKISPEARASVEKFDSFFLFLDKNQLNLKVFAEPVSRNGLVGVKENFSIQLGPIPLSNDTLRQLGLDVAQANNTNLRLTNLDVHAIELLQGEVNLSTSELSQ